MRREAEKQTAAQNARARGGGEGKSQSSMRNARRGTPGVQKDQKKERTEKRSPIRDRVGTGQEAMSNDGPMGDELLEV